MRLMTKFLIAAAILIAATMTTVTAASHPDRTKPPITKHEGCGYC
jgi:hypothetical protein